MNRVRELRERKDINQIDLATMLNVSQGTLSNWERNKFDIDNDSLIKIAEIFNVTTDYILGRSNDSAPPKDIFPTVEDEMFQKRKILFNKSAKVTGKDLDKFIKMMDIMTEEEDKFSE